MFLHGSDRIRWTRSLLIRRGLRAALVLTLPMLLLLSGCVEESIFPGIEKESLEDISWFSIYLVIMTTLAQMLLLVLILVLFFKMNRLVHKLDQISQNAGKFLKMGMTFFKKR